MSTDDIFDTILGNIEVIRTAPPGEYEAVVVGSKRVSNPNNGNKGMEVEFKLLAATGSQDLDGVDLSAEKVRETFWVTPKSARIVRDNLKALAPDITDDVSLGEAFDRLTGRRVYLDLEQMTQDRKGNPLRFPRLNVRAYRAA